MNLPKLMKKSDNSIIRQFIPKNPPVAYKGIAE